MDKIILSSGGTGGHIFPALACAEEIRRRWPKASLIFIGSDYGPEKDLARKAGLDFIGFPVRGFLGRGIKALDASLRMGLAMGKALGLIYKFRPDAVASFGGYAAFAPMLAARICGVPGILHEQNAIAGTGNRILAKLANKVCISWQGTDGFPKSKCVLTGNPVRSDIRNIVRGREKAAGQISKRLLVLGGSQGARVLNSVLPSMLAQLKNANVEILHQSGPRDLASTKAAYAQGAYSPDCVVPFIEDMGKAYAWADLVLCRAGASTIAELCAAGIPAVLVPFAAAIHDHQAHNARHLERAGAAELILEKDLDANVLQEKILNLLADKERLLRMGEAARSLACPDAAAKVVDALASVGGKQ